MSGYLKLEDLERSLHLFAQKSVRIVSFGVKKTNLLLLYHQHLQFLALNEKLKSIILSSNFLSTFFIFLFLQSLLFRLSRKVLIETLV